MEINLESKKWQEAIDITEQVQKVIIELCEKEKRIVCNKKSRVCLIFCPHTTSAITLNEGYDKGVMQDVLEIIDELTPRLDFLHKEGNSPAHAKSSLVGSSLIIPIQDGKLMLGQYQKVFFLEFDGPKQRKVEVSIL